MDRDVQEAIGAIELQLKRVAYVFEALFKHLTKQNDVCCVCVACGCSLLSPNGSACPVCATSFKVPDA